MSNVDASTMPQNVFVMIHYNVVTQYYTSWFVETRIICKDKEGRVLFI